MADRTEVRLIGADNVLRMLQQLPKEAVSKNGGVARQVLRKAARVILLEERKNLDAVTSNATSKGESESTGLLRKALTITRGKAPTSGNGERAIIKVRKKVYPKSQGSRREATTLMAAQLLEYGSSKQPAEPWIRPAFKAKAREAIEVCNREMISEVDKIAKKYLK